VFRDELDKAAPGRFDVQVHHSGTLFRQGAEPVAMQRGNLEMALLSMQDIARQMPEYSIFTAGYLIRDPDHLATVYGGPISYEVTRQIVLTGHLVDALQLAISSKTWHALSAAHRAQMKRAAAKAAKFNDENRVREEKELVEFFRAKGIEITVPDVAAFRKTVQ